MDRDPLTGEIIAAAIDVHKGLGPGLLESVYEQCLGKELELRGIQYARQVQQPVNYKGDLIECGFRLDLVVAGKVIVELKAVESLLPIHSAQLLTYMKLAKITTGLLMNFNVQLLKDGIKRFKL